VRRAGRRRHGMLLESGAEIWEHSTRMMHAKVLLADGRWSLVSSTNIDNRSFGLNDEVNLLARSESIHRELRAMFERDLRESTRLSLTGMAATLAWRAPARHARARARTTSMSAQRDPIWLWKRAAITGAARLPRQGLAEVAYPVRAVANGASCCASVNCRHVDL
jgi:phosphatidylserine/phosphatidylglycerophosphate/cardiolipin synthase-like enzyme